MGITFVKWVGTAVATWVLSEIIPALFEPYIERPLEALKRAMRYVALRLRLAMPQDEEEWDYEMA